MADYDSSQQHTAGAGQLYLYFLSVTAAVGAFLFGYDLSIMTGAQLFVVKHFDANIGWITASAAIGCIPGALLSTVLADKIGRKPTLYFAGLLFIISSVWTAAAGTEAAFNWARAIGGAGVGIATGVSPMYIAEISPPRLRGRMVTVNQLSIVVGIVISIVVGWVLSQYAEVKGHASWRWMFGSEVVPNLMLMFGLLFVPESPRWLASQGQRDKAMAVLSRINGKEQADKEMAEIQSELSEESGSFAELWQPGVRYALILACTLMIFQQINGVNMILLYAGKVLVDANIGKAVPEGAPLTESVPIAMFNSLYIFGLILLSTVAAFWVVAKFPRRKIMMAGITGMALGHVIMGVALLTDAHFIWTMVAMLVAAGSFTLTFAPVAWIVVSEMFPNRVRGKCMGIVTFCLFSSSAMCIWAFPNLLDWHESMFGTRGYAYFQFAAICMSCVAFIWLLIPETKDLTLEEIGTFWLHKTGSKTKLNIDGGKPQASS